MNALLDEGSTATLINEKIVKDIGARCKRTDVIIKSIGGENSISICNKKVNFQIVSDTNVFPINNALVVKNLSLPMQTINSNLLDFCAHKTAIHLKQLECPPDILLGQDQCNLIITREFRELVKNKLILSKCLLGWSIHGSLKTEKVSNVYNLNVNSDTCDSHCHEEIYKLIKSYFDLESLGIKSNLTSNLDDKLAYQIFDKTSKHKGHYWEVGLLWKDIDTDLPNSRVVALRRLYLIEKRLDRDALFADLYYKEMDRLFENNFAKPADETCLGKRIWYLPHFGVVNINKPGKVRLVFDAAAKTAGKSFNDLLLTGPDLLKNLLGVLMRFRQKPYAIKSDMRDMFLKIKIIKEDQDAQRFLWRGRDRIGQPKEYVMTSMIFGAKSSPSTALYIKNKNASNFSTRYPEAAKGIIENTYMDDYLDSCDSPAEAKARIHQVTEISKAANWELHSWASNDPSIVSDTFGNNHTNFKFKQLIEDSNEKVLGLKWQNQTDELLFNLNKNKISENFFIQEPTKRQFLAIIMSIFDPLGLLTPFTTQSRIIMQLIWATGINWDDKIPQNEFTLWKKWLQNLQVVKECRIVRCYVLRDTIVKSTELHVFCDASERAYAAVAYWKFIFSNGKSHVSIIMSKSRVTPLKSTSIPRLELQAALLASRIAKTIAQEHEFIINRRVFWSDSKTVLCWIRKDPRDFKMFVANRLGEIRENSNVTEWRWVPTRENPADDATRFVPEALKKGSRWLNGPKFLMLEENQWPIEISNKTSQQPTEFLLNQNIIATVVSSESSIIDFSRFSSLNRLLFTLSRVFQSIDLWKKRSLEPAKCYDKAFQYCIKMSQKMSFHDEITSLKNSKSLSKNSRLLCLNVYLDNENILRAEGRLSRLSKNISYGKLIVLDSKNIITDMLIKQYHEKYYHGSNETILNEIRQKFWIIGLRKKLRSVVSNCTICKILRAHPTNPKMSALPKERLAYCMRPFSHSGLDYFGPMSVKVGRRREKRWGALFTCLTTRAIHLEIVNSLSSDSAIMAIKRFSARRGLPLVFYSDNGTNFRAAAKELSEFWKEIRKDSLISEFTIKNKFVWKFIPPSAPHMGGAWERLVKSVKNALKVVLKDQAPKEELLHTLFTEIEHTINSRPLTHVSTDSRDPEALTPNHFLIGSSSGEIRFGRYDAPTSCSRKQWQTAQYFADCFWKRWLKEYLPTLMPSRKWHEKQENLRIGDIVLILDDNLPRNQWKKGIVIEVFPGTDGEVRIVNLKTAGGILTRAVRKLVKFA